METASAHCPKESPCRCADCGGTPAGYSPAEAEDGLRDGIVLTDGQDTVIYNQRSYCRLLQGLITTYTTAAPAEAAACMEARRGYFTAINDFLSASLESHAYPYYYAAVELYFGVHPVPDDHPGLTKIPPATPEGLALYREIEERLLRSCGLREPFVWEFSGEQEGENRKKDR